MKQVVNINELYKLIPEAQQLEGITFKDIRGLLTSVIEKVEESGKWEFVQYIAGNPSFFIVKETFRTPHKTVTTPAITSMKSEEKNNSETVKEKTENLYKSGQNSIQGFQGTQDGNTDTLFPNIKMPW